MLKHAFITYINYEQQLTKNEHSNPLVGLKMTNNSKMQSLSHSLHTAKGDSPAGPK